jgi:hypothetical protein
MARSRRTKPVAEIVETAAEQPRQESVTPIAEAPDVFDSAIAARQAEAMASTETHTPPTQSSNDAVRARNDQTERTPPHIANPSSTRRESHAEAVTRRLPDKLTVTAGDLKVQMIDAGRNEMGIGIRVAEIE